MSKILKNTTLSPIPLDVLGLPSIPASGQITIEVFDYTLLSSTDSLNYLTPLINSGDIVVNDGVNDLTVANNVATAQAIDFLRHPDTAFNVRFLAQPERVNGFESNNVQSAIEEVSDIANPLRVPIILIYNGTLSNGDWIGYSNLLPGDQTPVVSPISGNFVEFTWSNNNSSADFQLTFRKNSTTATPFFTWSVDNTQTDTVALGSPEPFNSGDTIFVQYTDQGSNARDAAIVLLFKS